MLLAIPDGAIALGVGAALAVGAAAAVLGPLWRAAEGTPDDDAADAARAPLTEGERVAERASAVDALREIEFDRATGKLSDADYAVLKATYTRRALAELRAREGRPGGGGAAAAAAAVADDEVEATIRSYRARAAGAVACVACGPRPEPDAVFCSSCGRYLPGRCARCGAACDAEGQRFCADCGHVLAA